MEVQAPLKIVNGKYQTIVNESVEALIIKVMYPRTAQNMHNLVSGTNTLVNLSIKSRQSVEKNICNNIPLLRLAQFGAYRKGYYNYVFDMNNVDGYSAGHIGFIGIVPLCESGALKFTAEEYLEILMTDLPTDTVVAIQGLEGAIYANHYMMYERGGLPTNEPQRTLPLNDLYDTLLIPVNASVEREYNESPNSYNNPLQKVQLFFGNANKPDCSYTRVDIKAINTLASGNDLVAVWSKSDTYDEARLHNNAVYPPFFPVIDNTTDPQGFYFRCFTFGGDDWQLLDLEDVDRAVIFKTTDQDLTYFVEKKVMI